ncbi:hypothetical protein SK128_024524, partial [Halocaridina rubra]
SGDSKEGFKPNHKDRKEKEKRQSVPYTNVHRYQIIEETYNRKQLVCSRNNGRRTPSRETEKLELQEKLQRMKAYKETRKESIQGRYRDRVEAEGRPEVIYSGSNPKRIWRANSEKEAASPDSQRTPQCGSLLPTREYPKRLFNEAELEQMVQ